MILHIENCDMKKIMRDPEFNRTYWGCAQQADLFRICMLLCHVPDYKVLMWHDENGYMHYQKIDGSGRYKLT